MEKTLKHLKEHHDYDGLKKIVRKNNREAFDVAIDLTIMLDDKFLEIFWNELEAVGHDLLWEAVLAEVGEQETVEDKIHRLEEAIKALKERKEDDLK